MRRPNPLRTVASGYGRRSLRSFRKFRTRAVQFGSRPDTFHDVVDKSGDSVDKFSKVAEKPHRFVDKFSKLAEKLDKLVNRFSKLAEKFNKLRHQV